MKDKQMACIVLGLMIALMAFGIQKMRQKKVAMQAEADEAKEKAEAAEFQRKTSERALADLKQESAGLREYSEKWLPYLGSVWNTEQEEQRIIEIVKTGQVFATSQRTEVLNSDKDGFISKRLRAHIVIQDDYSKTLNWLGHLEESLPSSRISTYRLMRGLSANDVQMEITLDLPLITTGKS